MAGPTRLTGGAFAHRDDAEFIARARTDMPQLLEAFNELRAENARLRNRARAETPISAAA